MSEPSCTAMDWLESMYGSEKSISCFRSSVIVMDEAIMSNLPPALRVGMSVSKVSGLE